MQAAAKKSPTVSVIIPTYNGRNYVCQAIDSVLDQTYTDYEILVIDDGSDEDITPLLAKYGDRVQYFYKSNSGPADTRNFGLKRSKGKYISFLDHDDLWHPDKLKVQAEILDHNPDCSLVYCYPSLIDADGRKIPSERPSHFPSGRVFLDFLRRNRITTFSASLIRRDIFDVVGLLDDSPCVTICEDYDLWLRIADVSEVLFTPEDLVLYRVHPGNLVRNYDTNLNSHLYVLNKALAASATLKKLPGKEVAKIKREHLYNKLLQFAFVHYYKTGDSRKARDLFSKSLLAKPYDLKPVPYLILSCLPPVRELLRKLKG